MENLPKKRKQPDAGRPPTPKEQLAIILDKLVPERKTGADMLIDLKDQFNVLIQGHLVKLTEPTRWLPDSLNRKTFRGQTYVCIGNAPILGSSLAELKATIVTSAGGAQRFYGDEEWAFVIPRFYIADGKLYTDTAIYTRKIHALMPEIIEEARRILGEAEPSIPQLARVILAFNSINKQPRSIEDIHTKLRGVTNGIPDLLKLSASHEVTGMVNLANALISALVTDDVIDSLVKSASRGEITVDLLYDVVGPYTRIPIPSFGEKDGFMKNGTKLVSKKLSECEDDDPIILVSKIRTKAAFLGITDDRAVYVMPTDGLYRKGPKKGGKNTFVPKEVDTTLAGVFKKLAIAIKNAPASGLQAKSSAKKAPVEDAEELDFAAFDGGMQD